MNRFCLNSPGERPRRQPPQRRTLLRTLLSRLALAPLPSLTRRQIIALLLPCAIFARPFTAAAPAVEPQSGAVPAAGTWEQRPDGVQLALQEGALRLQVCDEKIVRFLYDPSGRFDLPPSLVVIREWPPLPFQLKSGEDELEVTTASLRVRIDRRSGSLSFLTPDGESLLREDPEAPRQMTPAIVQGERTWNARLQFRIAAGEALYGLGQHQEGRMNYRGDSLTLVQENTRVAVPFMLSSRGYGLLLDNSSRITFRERSGLAQFNLEVADAIDYYFFAGRDADDVIRGLRLATGQAPLFGRWAYGYWQSKERYKDETELLAVARDFRQRRIPVDALVQDWQYWGEEWRRWNAMEFDASRYPHPEEMISELHQRWSLHLMLSIWPVLGPETAAGQELHSRGFLYAPFHWTDGHTYDAYSAEARQIFWRHLERGLFAKGADAWWMDATEPEVLVAPTERSTKAAGRNALGTMSRYLNTYSLMATSAVYNGQRAASREKRVFILTRSAFAGQQRHAAATWSGDIVADWGVFRRQIPAGLNFCMSGIPYWSNDIGGFHVYRYGGFPGGCENPGYRELYVRWFQYGAFNPIFRAHGTDTPREIWRFGAPGTPAYDALRKCLDLRYRLLPYFYSLAWRVTTDGYTMMRGLAMDFNDSQVFDIDDQYMFGPAMLICPVTEPFYTAENSRSELIPDSCLFSDAGRQGGFNARYFSGASFDTLVTDSLQSMPLFDQYLGYEIPPQVRWDRNSLRWSGWIQAPGAGDYTLWLTSDDAVRWWIDDTLRADRWNSAGLDVTDRLTLHFTAGERRSFRIEQARLAGATKLRLAWATPAMAMRPLDPARESGVRRLYLPAGGDWYDFWSGERLRGGEWIGRAVPLDIMPIYIRAGSIVPMGPRLQYAAEKPADPLELRIYPGADGQFLLYEDEGDGYNYEHGLFTTILFVWDDKNSRLTIGGRQGSFPGMLEERTFIIVRVSPGQGGGVEPPAAPQERLRYRGEQVVIQVAS